MLLNEYALMNLSNYLDSTYLKLPSQANLSEEQTKQKVIQLIQDAIVFNFKLVMIRSNYISLAKKMIHEAKASVLTGTVIGFHEGTNTIEEKLIEAQKSIDLGVDELDFVINYHAFKNQNTTLVQKEVLKGTSLGLKNNKVVKWIIEVAALTDNEIAEITKLIRSVVVTNFSNKDAEKVFVKSSTGFFKTENNVPNGATIDSIKIIVKNAKPLQIKAAGGVKSKQDVSKMIALGVTRIGTSSAKEIIQEKSIKHNY